MMLTLDDSCPDIPCTLGGLFYEMGRRGVALRCDGKVVQFTYLRDSAEAVSEELEDVMRRNKSRIMAAFAEPLE